MRYQCTTSGIPGLHYVYDPTGWAVQVGRGCLSDVNGSLSTGPLAVVARNESLRGRGERVVVIVVVADSRGRREVGKRPSRAGPERRKERSRVASVPRDRWRSTHHHRLLEPRAKSRSIEESQMTYAGARLPGRRGSSTWCSARSPRAAPPPPPGAAAAPPSAAGRLRPASVPTVRCAAAASADGTARRRRVEEREEGDRPTARRRRSGEPRAAKNAAQPGAREVRVCRDERWDVLSSQQSLRRSTRDAAPDVGYAPTANALRARSWRRARWPMVALFFGR